MDTNQNIMESFRIKINPAFILSMAISNAIPQLAPQLPLLLVVVGHKIPPESKLQTPICSHFELNQSSPALVNGTY